MREQKTRGLRMLEIERAKQRVRAGDAGARLQKQTDAFGIGNLACVIERFAVIGISSGLQQQASQGGVVIAPLRPRRER